MRYSSVMPPPNNIANHTQKNTIFEIIDIPLDAITPEAIAQQVMHYLENFHKLRPDGYGSLKILHHHF